MYKLIPVLMMVLVLNFSATPVQAEEPEVSADNAELIASLLKQVAQLTAILEELKAKEVEVNFSHTLTLGSTDQATNGEVTKLQEMLIAEGVYPAGIVSGYFGTLTSQAVVALKQKYNISPATSTFEPSTKEAIKVAVEEAGKIEGKEFFHNVLDVYEKNYGYRELMVDESYVDYIDTSIKTNTVSELVYDYVNKEGSVGEMSVTTYVENEYGLFGFENEFDFIGSFDDEDQFTFIRLTSFDDENPFLDEDQKDGLNDLLNEWQRISKKDQPSVTLTGVLDPDSMRVLFSDGTYVINANDGVINSEFSEIFDQEIYSYEVEVDLDGMETFFKNSDLIEAINNELEFTTGYKTYAEARENVYDIKTQLLVTGDRLFGLQSSYSIDFQDVEGNDVTLIRSIEWVADTVLTEKIDIQTPKEYINVN